MALLLLTLATTSTVIGTQYVSAMVVVTDTTTAVMCRQCQVVVVIKTSKSRIKEFFRRFVKNGVFADNN